ncbi:MAG TPA: ATP-binding protein [Thermoanaerobaculia bacterium]|nr:ATP-binding protein [Thermoanaerobaculia bacterium]
MAPFARICLIGPESTGKSALAAQLATRLGLPVAGEFARDYAEQKGGRLTYQDVEPIARGEVENLDAVPGPAILDTDLISTVVYSRYYYGRCPQWIEDEARRRRADLYLLMDTDVPWTPDSARDAGGDAREDLFDAFRAALDEFETNWTIVSGDGDERLQRASEAAGGSLLGG